MAYGNTARNTGRLGHRARGTAQQKRGGGGGSRRYKIPQAGEYTSPMLLFRGLYRIPLIQPDGKTREEEFEYGLALDHYVPAARGGKGGGFACTAGLYEDADGFIMEGPKPCMGCHTYMTHGKGGPVGRANKKHLFNAILMDNFHVVDGDPIPNQPGRFFKEHVRCTGRRCTYCKKGQETVFGQRVSFTLGVTHVDQLSDFDLFTLAQTCVCGGELEPVAFSCGSCGAKLVDLETDEVTDAEFTSFQTEEFHCEECKATGFMVSVNTCKQCDTPQALSMWNTIIRPVKSGTGTSTALVIQDYRAATAEEMESVKELLQATPLDKVFRTLRLEEQAELLSLPVPPELAAQVKPEGRGAEAY